MTQWGLDTLFNPAKRHMDEEKRRLQSTREQLGDASGGRRIDLESGKVTIRRSSEPAAPEQDAGAEVTPEAEAGEVAVTPEAGGAEVAPEPPVAEPGEEAAGS